MARMTLRGFYDLIQTKTYARFDISSDTVYQAIIDEIQRNNITCNASIERVPYRFKNMESEGKVLFLSERGLFTLFVTICTVGNYTQVQVFTRNVARRYSYDDANHAMEVSMHNLYKDAVNRCINNTLDYIAEANKWSQLTSENNEMEAQQ